MSPEVLDWLASDFVAHDYDLKHLIATIVTSRAYQMPAVARTGEAPARGYAFRGPELRRLTAEQFADAIGTITGEWSVLSGGQSGSGGGARGRGPGPRTDSDPSTYGIYVREYRNNSSHLSRALGRPIRDQVTSARAVEATTLQSLELVNGEILTSWLARGARRMSRLPAAPLACSRGGRGRNLHLARSTPTSRCVEAVVIIADTGRRA